MEPAAPPCAKPHGRVLSGCADDADAVQCLADAGFNALCGADNDGDSDFLIPKRSESIILHEAPLSEIASWLAARYAAIDMKLLAGLYAAQELRKSRIS